MRCTPAIQNLIREDKVAQIVSAMQTGQTHGMQTLEQARYNLVQQGLIAPDG
jgi:twitching motility protein PilT